MLFLAGSSSGLRMSDLCRIFPPGRNLERRPEAIVTGEKMFKAIWGGCEISRSQDQDLSSTQQLRESADQSEIETGPATWFLESQAEVKMRSISGHSLASLRGNVEDILGKVR